MKAFEELITNYIQQKQEKKGVPVCVSSWIDDAAQLASQVSVVTHAAKYSHGDSKSSSLFQNVSSVSGGRSNGYITTASLMAVPIDLVCSAGAMGVAGFLTIQVDETMLLDFIFRSDPSPLKKFAESEEQLSRWMKGFSSVFEERPPKSHTFSKQIYFPVGEREYHLLSPLFPSGLAHTLYEKVQISRYSEEAKEIRQKRRDRLFSEKATLDYPDLGVQTFGGTKPQNISLLNSRRGGKVYLLPSLPPIWKSSRKAPQTDAVFWHQFKYDSKPVFERYVNFLRAVKNYNNKAIREKSKEYVSQIIDQLFFFADQIESLGTGWSKNSSMSLHIKLWLDPNYSDEKIDFQAIRETVPWIDMVANDFSTSVMKLLKKHLDVNDDDRNFIKNCLVSELKMREN